MHNLHKTGPSELDHHSVSVNMMFPDTADHGGHGETAVNHQDQLH